MNRQASLYAASFMALVAGIVSGAQFKATPPETILQDFWAVTTITCGLAAVTLWVWAKFQGEE